MLHVLIKGKKYEGKYVAVKSFDDGEIVGVGQSPSTAYEQARKNGSNDPVVTFVPKKDMVQIY